MKISIDLLQPQEPCLSKTSQKKIREIYDKKGEAGLKIDVIPWDERYIITDGNNSTYFLYKQGYKEINVNVKDPEKYFDEPEDHEAALRHANSNVNDLGISHIRDLEGRLLEDDEIQALYFKLDS